MAQERNGEIAKNRDKEGEDFKHFRVNRKIECEKEGKKQVGMGGEKSQVKEEFLQKEMSTRWWLDL